MFLTRIDHANYPKSLKTLSVESLRYIANDCKAAIAAYPDGHKAGYYADEIHYIAAELRKRDWTNDFKCRTCGR